MKYTNRFFLNSCCSSSCNNGSSILNQSFVFVFMLVCLLVNVASSDWSPGTLVDKSVPRPSRFGHCAIAVESSLLFSNNSGAGNAADMPAQSDDRSASGSSSEITYPVRSIWVFGGVDQYSKLLIDSLFIIEEDSNYSAYPYDLSRTPQLRWAHSCTLLDSSSILIFGGSNVTTAFSIDSLVPTYSDTWLYNTTSNVWRLLSTGAPSSNSTNPNTTSPPLSNATNQTDSGLAPSVRMHQAIASNQTFMFLFGGLGADDVILNDFWVFDVANQQWTEINSNSTRSWPLARYGHTATYIHGKFCLYGGFTYNNLALGDFWCFDPIGSEWTSVGSYSAPTPRGYHMMDTDATGKNKAIYIYGGQAVDGSPLRSLEVYDLDTKLWYKIDPDTLNPPPIYLASLSYSPHFNRLYMYGGVNTESESLWKYNLDCDCNGKGGCFYGVCNCFSGYFGEYCANSIDGPILLGLGLAICVPILCFGWCILRCAPLVTRLKVLTLMIIVTSSLLFISVQTSLASWLPVSILSLITGLNGVYSAVKSKRSKVIAGLVLLDALSLIACALGLLTYLPSCMQGNCRNDSGSSWQPKFAIIMAFVDASFLALVLPIGLKLYRHRRLFETISSYPSITATSHSAILANMTPGMNPLLKKLADNSSESQQETNQKALNYLAKEGKLRIELNRIRLMKATEEIRITVDRNNVLEDSYTQVSILPTNMVIQNFNIKFVGEEGVDMGGLKKEWFSLMFKKLFDPEFGLFVMNNNYTLSVNANSHQNSDHLALFYFTGRMIAKSVAEGVHLEHTFSRTIYKLILGKQISLDDLAYVDAEYHKSLLWMLENSIEDMEEVTFSTMIEINGEMQLVDLIPNGRDIAVTEDNKHEFVKLLSMWRFKRDITDQSYQLVLGFHEVIPLDHLAAFNECELELFMCGLTEIDVQDWKKNTIYRGFNTNSNIIEWFWQIVEEMEMENRVRLLQFVTGNARLPPTGFQCLMSADGPTKFQIHRTYAPDNQLPVARTCFNRLDLPNYTSKEQLQNAIEIAIHEGLPGFGIA